ncbi:hypothetical protein SLE2022_107460 [Rubroshorea leprosula]
MGDGWKLLRLKRRLFRVLVVFLWCQGLVCCSLNDEGLALMRLKERVVNDPFGALSNWKAGDGVVDPCSWFGVECSLGQVVVLNLKDLCLEGTLAPELGNLIHIKSIILRNNSFAGIIPDGVGALKELEVLDLGYNNFTGPLPVDIGGNLSLTILLLDNNELLGSFCPEINEIQKLSETQVDEDWLSNSAKSSCSRRFITGNSAQTEDRIQRRLLQENRRSPRSTPSNLPPASVEPSKIPPSPSPSPTPSPSPSPSPSPTPSPSPPPSPSPDVSSSQPPPTSVSSSQPPPTSETKGKHSSSSQHQVALLAGVIGAAVFVPLIIGTYLWKCNKGSAVKPWATGLSGQLQKAFVTGVPKLKRSELEAACEDFSNVIGSSPIGTIYKGTLSNGVEIAVASVPAASSKDWSTNLETQFRKKIDTLSKVNHKNFVNLLGYCEEEDPFTRMMVFEYAPNGTLFEHLHFKESEHLHWGMRLRIAMGIAYCLEHMHQLNPPMAHNNLSSSAVNLAEDYAAKISDFSFWNEIAVAEGEAGSKKLSDSLPASPESNVYSFGVLLFEMVMGRIPLLVDNGSLGDWASDYLRGKQPLVEMVDPTLNSFDEKQLEKIGEVIKSCVCPDPSHRPTMREVTARLREITTITPDRATPKLSPLWWAELEILSGDAS